MYVASVLVFTKVYQFRHPDAAPRAYYAYGLVAYMLIFETLGYYIPTSESLESNDSSAKLNFMFMCLFIVAFYLAYITFVVFFYRKMYFAGDNEYCKKLHSDPTKRKAFMMLVMIANIALVIGFAHRSLQNNDSVVSNKLLALFGANMATYVMYYMMNKYVQVIRHKKYNESLTWKCWMYLALSISSFLIGFSYFTDSQKDKLNSPAMSRNLNQECTMWFFDHHDIWHFASAFGLFFGFMFLLTMEDNNTSVPWKDIPVF